MGDGGKTVKVPNDGSKTVTVKAKIPTDCYPTGVTYACNKPVQKPVQAPNNNVGGNNNCIPCQSSWTTKVGNFFGRIGRGIWNCTSGLFRGVGSLLCGTATLAGGILGGIGNAFGRLGASLNNSAMMMQYNSMPVQTVYTMPQQTFSYSSTSTLPAYPFSMLPTTPMYSSYNNNGFMSGLLFGSMLSNNNHHHCHGHISRPLVISRPIVGFRRPLCRPCGW